MFKLTLSLALALSANSLSGQSLAVNTDGSTASASALLDVKSTSKGMLIPRMSKAQKNAIASPANGLMVFQQAPDSIGIHFYNGSSWIWLANAAANTAWLMEGNSGTTPGTNFIGTTDASDLIFKTNGFENLRLTTNALAGLYEDNPQYALDLGLGAAAVNPCTRNGIRIKSVFGNDACDNGLFLGYQTHNLIDNVLLWNYGNNSSSAENFIFGMNSFEWMRLTRNGFIGLGEQAPQYTMDIKAGMAAVNPCTRNGLRINLPFNDNDCSKGLFVGYGDVSSADVSSFWNFGAGGFPSGYSIRFGLGSDFTTGEKMRITNAGIGAGVTDPLAKLHLVENTGSVLAGMLVTSVLLPSTSYGFYAGLKGTTSTAQLWNYQNNDIEIGTNDLLRMTVSSGGNVGIATASAPTSTLQVDGTVAVGVSLNITGGSSASPHQITSEKAYLGLDPAPGSDHYYLPDPSTCVGRIYYVRNTSGIHYSYLGTVAGEMCTAFDSNCLGAGNFYTMNNGATSKTVICISDGTNWIVGKLN